MTMDEVNDRFPLTKYKAWMASRAEEGLPTAGGVAAPHTPSSSLRNLQGATSTVIHQRSSQGNEKHEPPTSSTPQNKENADKEAVKSPPTSADQPVGQEAANPVTDNQPAQQPDNSAPQASPAGEGASHPPAVAPTRQEVHDDNDMDDDDQIQIAVPTEMLANPGDSCAICIDTLEDDDDVRGLTCGHAFHASCLDPWLTSRRACCPLCKADYYVPKPRVEGDAATEADRHAGRRPPGMSGVRIDGAHQQQYAFMNRRDGRPRMILPGRFMAIGHFDDTRTQRYGFPTVQRQPRPSDRNPESNGDPAEAQGDQPNTWRSHLPNLTIPRPTLPARFRRRNASPDEQSNIDSASNTATVSANLTPAQLEAGSRS